MDIVSSVAAVCRFIFGMAVDLKYVAVTREECFRP